MSVAAPLNVLIVEDEAVLAMELEYAIEDAGHAVAGWATCLSEANDLIKSGNADLALVDIHLADGITGVEVADRLSRETGAAVVFMTANAKLIPRDFVGALGVISKPYTTGGLQAVLKYLEQGITAPPPSLRQPTGLTLAPDYRDRWSR
ncbi:MAG TPA: response regulator [Methylobacterium sp.]|jgi:DNA-binding LytR/AlgR family response regulator|nr:response regulator [Methylobacterium sp.]